MRRKQTLRKGGYGDLNFYYIAHFSPSLGEGWERIQGIAAFPQRTQRGSQVFINDGVSILADTAEGGRGRRLPSNYAVASHEIGHWMGLYHTFQGGCYQGDGVDDTEAQQAPTQRCTPQSRPFSCGSPDPIFNFMDYAPP